jgi:hypothetical protein
VKELHLMAGLQLPPAGWFARFLSVEIDIFLATLIYCMAGKDEH